MRSLAATAFATVLAASTVAAQNEPHIGYIYPAGGRQGSSFEVRIGGQFLQGATNVHTNAEGIDVEILEYKRPFNNRELNLIREKIKEIRDSKSKKSGKDSEKNSGEALKTAKEIREKIEKSKADPRFEEAKKRMLGIFDSCLKEDMTADEKIVALRELIPKKGPKIQENKQLAESIIARISLAQDLQAGSYELRLISGRGVTNPIKIRCDDLPESIEEEPNDIVRDFEKQQPLSLPATLNGQIMPGDTDCFRFSAKAGERILVQARARELLPYMADAVPGWFQATLKVYDDKQREIAYADDNLFHPDPVLTAKIPRDGIYTVEIRDAIYRGREDFVYRISMREAGKATAVETETDPVRNRLLAEVRDLPKMRENEPNNRSGDAQKIEMPALINGSIADPDDIDFFRITGRKGDEVVAEVYGRRLNSPIDSVLLVTDSEGKTLCMNDDESDRGASDHLDRRAGLTTHDADSYLRFTLPHDGSFFVQLKDMQSQGGSDYRYALRLSQPRPDFAVKVLPSSISLRRANSEPISVYALRKDGFDGPITVELADAPRGISIEGNKIPPELDKLTMTLSTRNPEQVAVPLRFVARAEIDGKIVEHPAIPADDVMQAFLNRHLVTAEETLAYVTARWGPALLVPKKDRYSPLILDEGKTTDVSLIRFGKRKIREGVRPKISGPKQGIEITRSDIGDDGKTLTIAVKSDESCPRAGNLIFDIEMERSMKNGKKKNIHLGATAAIPFVCRGAANAE